METMELPDQLAQQEHREPLAPPVPLVVSPALPVLPALPVQPEPLGPPELEVQRGRLVRLARRVRWGPLAYKVLPVSKAPPAPPA